MYTIKIFTLIVSYYFLSVLPATRNCVLVEACDRCPTNEGRNFSVQDWLKGKQFQANVQIFKFYDSNGSESKIIYYNKSIEPENKSNDSTAKVICNKKCVIPEDYKVTKGLGAYKLHKTPVNWDQARQICASEGAHLGVFGSMSEIYHFREIMVANHLKDLWIGYHDMFQEGDWTNVLDVPMSKVFVNWKPGEPNNWKNNENCAFLEYTNMLDAECSTPIAFICKISIDDCNLGNESDSNDYVTGGVVNIY